MEVVVKWNKRERLPRENADGFVFEAVGPQRLTSLRIWIPDEVQQALRRRFIDEWVIMQAALGKATLHVRRSGSLAEPIENVWIEDETDPLDGAIVSAVDVHCHHLIGRDRQARCQIDHLGFRDLPVHCVPGKNACWRQVCVTE